MLIYTAWMLPRVRRLIEREGINAVKHFIGVPRGKLEPTQAKLFVRLVNFVCSLAPFDCTCLVRSTLLVHLLRKNSVCGVVVVGVRHEPVASHAWVEVNKIPISQSSESLKEYDRIAEF